MSEPIKHSALVQVGAIILSTFISVVSIVSAGFVIRLAYETFMLGFNLFHLNILGAL